GASLRNATVHANVKTCDFSDADLSGADFQGSALCSTTFLGAKMGGADFKDAYNHGYDLGAGEKPDW
ncbi:MAG TPA: pentapeptide repeat-containing protein, partial [Sphingomonas sp.]|nr:pentapeptide repeat-containing protein [Sphingomonas sp.]